MGTKRSVNFSFLSVRAALLYQDRYLRILLFVYPEDIHGRTYYFATT